MDIVERLLGRTSTTNANARADSIDVHTKRMVMAQHNSTFTREDSISVAKRRSQKARSRELLCEQQAQQDRRSSSGLGSPAAAAAGAGAAGAAAAATGGAEGGPAAADTSARAPPPGGAERSSVPSAQPTTGAGKIVDRSRSNPEVVYDSDIDLLSPEEEKALSNKRTDSIQLAKKKNPHIAKEHKEHREHKADGAASFDRNKGAGIFRQIIHRLTGSVTAPRPGEPGGAAPLSSAPSHNRRSIKSDPGDGLETLHRYCPPPPGVTIRPALTHRSTDVGTPTPRTKSTSWQDHPFLPGTPTRTARTNSLDQQPSIGANGLDSTFTHADILSVPASNPFA